MIDTKKLKEYHLLILFIPVILIYTLLILPECSGDTSDTVQLVTEEKFAEPKPDEFGLLTDSLTEFRSEVKRNETLSDILNPHNIPLQKIYRIAEKSKKIFDLTRIKFGQDYTIYSQTDSLESVRYFIYEIDPINYVVCDFTDSIYIYADTKNVITKIKEV